MRGAAFVFWATILLNGCAFRDTYGSPTAQSTLQTLGAIYTLGAIPYPRAAPQAVEQVAPSNIPVAQVYAKDSTQSISNQYGAAFNQCPKTRTRMDCSQHFPLLQDCLTISENSNAVLQFERQYAKGERPEVAARAANQAIGYPDLGAYHEIAMAATETPPTMSPEEFSNRVMRSCVKSIGL